MSLQSVELCNHHRAGRAQRVPIWIWDSARQEDLGKARIRSRHFARIVGSGNDQVMNHLSDVLDPLGWDATTVRIAQEETPSLGK
jgi:hypothetical protein